MSQMNLWTRYKVKCPDNTRFTFGQLNMKRKAVTLQHRQNAFGISKKNKFNLIVQGRYYNNKTPTSDPPCVRGISYEDSSPASTNDVPGDKSFMIKNDISVPIYNYIPVKRTYKGGANKYPYTAWSYGKAGFPPRSKGSSAESRAAAARELSNNAPLYSKLALTSCDFIPCRGKTLAVTLNSAYQYCYIDNSSIILNPAKAPPHKFKWLEIPDYSPQYNLGGAWAYHVPNENIIQLVTIYKNKPTFYFIYQPHTSAISSITDITTKPFLVLQNDTLVSINANFQYTFTSDLKTDCSNIFFNYTPKDKGVPFDTPTLNRPTWIKKQPSPLCTTPIECYWWNNGDSTSYIKKDISLNFGKPTNGDKKSLQNITTKQKYEITITCGN